MDTQNICYEYFAFISYKREDEKWAKWLQKKLESYSLPTAIRKKNPELPNKIRPIFRDQSELSGGNLKAEIEKGLKGSKYLIVVCSPRSAKSPWVSKEVQYFIDHGRVEYIIPFIIGGTPNATNPEEECFPEGLRQLTGEKEIIGININEMGRDAAVIKIIARMFNLRFDSLWQRQQREELRKRRIKWFTLILTIVVLSLVSLFIYRQNFLLKLQTVKILSNEIQNLVEEGNAETGLLIANKLYKLGYPNIPEFEMAVRKAFETDSSKSFFVEPIENDEIIIPKVNPRNKLLVTNPNDSTIALYSLINKCFDKIFKMPFSPNNIAYCDSLKLVFVGSYDGIRMYNYPTLGEKCFAKTTFLSEFIDISASDKIIVSINSFSKKIVCDIFTYSQNSLRYICTKHLYIDSNVESMILVNGHTMITGHSNGDVVSWNITSGDKNWTLKNLHDDYVKSLILSSNKEMLYSGGLDGKIFMINRATGQVVKEPLMHQRIGPTMGGVYTLSLSSDNKFLYSGSSDKCIRKWDIINWSDTPINILKGHQNTVTNILNIDKQGCIVSFSKDRTLRFWGGNIDRSIKIKNFYTNLKMNRGFSIEGVDSESKNILIITGEGLFVWNYKNHKLSNKQFRLPLGTELPFSAYEFIGSKDLSKCAFINKNRLYILLLNYKDNTATSIANIDSISAFTFSESSDKIIFIRDRKIQEYDIEKKLINKRCSVEYNYEFIKMSFDGSTMVAYNKSKQKICVLKKNDDIRFVQPRNDIRSLAISHNGNILAIGYKNGIIDYYNLENYNVKSIAVHNQRVNNMVFSRDDYLFSSSQNAVITNDRPAHINVYDLKREVEIWNSDSFPYIGNIYYDSKSDEFFIGCKEQISIIKFVDFAQIMACIDSISQNRDISDKLKYRLGFSE